LDNQSNKKAAQVFANAFAVSLAESLTQAVGSPLKLQVQDTPDLAASQGKPVHYRLTMEGALHGECFVEFYEPLVAQLGSKILGETEAGDYTIEQADELKKVVSSAMPAVSAALVAEYGELTFKVDRVADLAFGGMLVVPLSATLGEQTAVPVLLYFDGQFMTTLSSQPAAEKLPIDPANLKLVMDVELNVSLRFGQRELPLREVLELAAGSVIELDRQVDDPVELLLDGKVIARGEAVIVDGNYGLRVTEVPQPMASHFA